jgi:hypothetical protein
MWTDLPPVLLAELEKPDNLDILEELQDAEFASRQHYSRATYAEGRSQGEDLPPQREHSRC